MKKRVVITGMGVVSPNGIGNEAFCRAILAGTSGVKRVRSFDPSDLPVQIAGEVQDFDELAWVDAHERKHVSRVVPLALAASTEALRDAGIETSQLSLEQQREIGVALGSGGGAQEFSEEQVRLWLQGKVKQVSLFCIPSGTMGTLSSEISMRFGLRGMSHVITTGCTSSTDAFGYALRQIQFGFLPMMLVGGVDAPIAPDSSWPKAHGCSFWKNMNTPAHEERKSSPRSRDMAQPVRPSIGSACRSAVKSLHAPFRWRWKTQASRRPMSAMSIFTALRRS